MIKKEKQRCNNKEIFIKIKSFKKGRVGNSVQQAPVKPKGNCEEKKCNESSLWLLSLKL